MAVNLSRREFLAASLGAAAATMTGRGRAAEAEADRPPFIDTHVHFYDPTRPEGVPWPGKHDPLLYRVVLPEGWDKLVAPLGPAGAIVVEASPWVEDNQWLLDLAERHDAARLPGMLGIVGIVGSLPLEDEAAAALIDRFAKQPRFRGIRVNGDKLLAGLDDAGYVSRLARLADHGLALDVNGGRVFDAVAAVAARFPELRVVLEHMANTRITAAGPLPDWLAAVEAAARQPNVFLKVSALVENAAHSMQQPRAPVDPTFYEPWLDAVWKAFGSERLMYGSNWPVSARAADYAAVHGIVAAYMRGRGPEAERRFFTDTSRVAYRWE